MSRAESISLAASCFRGPRFSSLPILEERRAHTDSTLKMQHVGLEFAVFFLVQRVLPSCSSLRSVGSSARCRNPQLSRESDRLRRQLLILTLQTCEIEVRRRGAQSR